MFDLRIHLASLKTEDFGSMPVSPLGDFICDIAYFQKGAGRQLLGDKCAATLDGRIAPHRAVPWALMAAQHGDTAAAGDLAAEDDVLGKRAGAVRVDRGHRVKQADGIGRRLQQRLRDDVAR